MFFVKWLCWRIFSNKNEMVFMSKLQWKWFFAITILVCSTVYDKIKMWFE